MNLCDTGNTAAGSGHEFVRGFTVPMHGQEVTRDATEARGDRIQLDLLKGAVLKGVHHVVGPKQSHRHIGLENGREQQSWFSESFNRVSDFKLINQLE